MEENTELRREYKTKLTIKESARGRKYFEYSIRADSVEELRQLKDQVKQIAEEECREGGDSDGQI